MLDILTRGGFIMVPILLGSVLALTIIIERFWILQRSKIFPDTFLIRIDEMIKTGQRDSALAVCQSSDSNIAKILEAGLQNSHRARSEITEALQMAGRLESAGLSRWVGTLGTIAALEPLMGLLGTVLGLIEAFREVEQLQVVGNPSVVASGVWQALITTAAGLIIAIPVYAFYRYFRGKVSGLIMELEQHAFGLVQQLTASEHTKPVSESVS